MSWSLQSNNTFCRFRLNNNFNQLFTLSLLARWEKSVIAARVRRQLVLLVAIVRTNGDNDAMVIWTNKSCTKRRACSSRCTTPTCMMMWLFVCFLVSLDREMIVLKETLRLYRLCPRHSRSHIQRSSSKKIALNQSRIRLKKDTFGSRAELN